MKFFAIFSLIVVILTGLILSQSIDSENEIKTYLDRSVPYVGTEIPRIQGIDGSGIKIAVIDTGVDFNHPDLFGWGPDGKVIGGYNFIQRGEPPLDKNGHGTQVAGVIAADGQATGIAPKAKILAYKVSEDGEGVSSELIIEAIEMAIKDGADIINISLGVNKTNSKIERAVNYALEKEIFVVTAAGNDGPGFGTIGSPGRNYGSVTVGATYNNLTSSLVATLEVDEKPYTVIPMVGSTKVDDPITGKIVFGGYGKIDELSQVDTKDSIVLVERGSDVEGELLYFSIKENNAANAGAKALIVYNNIEGIFLGELIHEFMEPDYKPQIPVVSIDRDEGLEIKNLVINEIEGSLHLFYNPDFVAHFSSRGPVSPFYIKPEIVAPGAYINTTQNNAGYNFTSGTSYAAPHVSGAAALLLQKNPNLHHHEIKSILLTTAMPVSDAYGQEFSISESGSGRIDIANAFDAKLVIMPPNFVSSVSSDHLISEQQFELKVLEGSLDYIQIDFEGPEFIKFAHFIEGEKLITKMSMTEKNYGDHEGKIIIYHNEIRYVVPFLLHYTQGSVLVNQQNDKLIFDIYHPENWSFAKITVTNSKDGKTSTTTMTPNKQGTIDIFENSEYWIDAKIRTNKNSSSAYNTIEISTLDEKSQNLNLIELPEKQILIISGIVIAVGIVGILKRK
ncbi:S8 family serine peptidase [Nitrosopumilus sp.]|uniref:S8 family serine peptidase n=1 Tax=Nitrosopumilus sp. TaxID=2024843 RepID=UPI002610DA3C|nr:S8 family serine peptidase [Nitrosopumilus sp.]